MFKKRSLWSEDSKGKEILYSQLNKHVDKKYSPDSPFFHSFVPYIMLFVCGLVDLVVFKSMFDLTSYDNGFIRVVSIIGLLIAFDVTPIYLGVHLKRIEEKLDTNRVILIILLVVTLLGLGLNTGLRIATIDEVAPVESTEQSNEETMSMSNPSSETNQEDNNGQTLAIALTAFGCILPVVTSLASGCISYLSFDPLLIRKKKVEKEINEKEDEIRRFRAIIADYEYDENFEENFEERLQSLDSENYNEMCKIVLMKTIKYSQYVRRRVAEYLGDPASSSALANEDINVLLKRMDEEMSLINNFGQKDSLNSDVVVNRIPSSNIDEAVI